MLKYSLLCQLSVLLQVYEQYIAYCVLHRGHALICSGACAQLMRQVALAREEASAAGQPLEADRLAERLRCLGHSVTVRTALGGGGGGECLRNLRHTFLNCAVHGALLRLCMQRESCCCTTLMAATSLL